MKLFLYLKYYSKAPGDKNFKFVRREFLNKECSPHQPAMEKVEAQHEHLLLHTADERRTLSWETPHVHNSHLFTICERQS